MTDRALTDPVLVEIVAGHLASVEQEVETAIGRTSRSPMIRDAHDYRAGIHDRRLRKLTGRSYSALVHPVVRDYPTRDDAARRRVLPQRRLPLRGRHRPPARPVRDRAGVPRLRRRPEVVAFVQAFGHHDDIGGAVPGSMPSSATSVFEEGLMVPPIRLWDAGVPNEAALKIMTRNSRMPESLAADLDAECSACLMGARRMARAVRPVRPGDRRGLLRRDPRADHRDVPARDPRQDPGRRVRLGGLRRARRRRRAPAAHPADHPDPHRRRRPGRGAAGDRLHRHRPAGEGADQPLRRLRRRQLPEEVAGADPAQPRRHARADGRARRQRGRRAADRDALPAARARCSPRSSRPRPTPARS